MYIHAHIWTYICIYIFMYICIHIYIYIHTQMSHDSIIQVMTHEPITSSQAIAHTTPANSKPDTNMTSNVNSTPAPILGGEGGGGDRGMRQNIKSKCICTHMTNILGRNICTLKCSIHAHAHVHTQKHTRTRVCVTNSEGDSQGLPGFIHPRILGIPTISFQLKLYFQRCGHVERELLMFNTLTQLIEYIHVCMRYIHVCMR